VNMLQRHGRRTFLRGAAGATLALPMLRFTEAAAASAGDPKAKRFVVCFSHGGTILSRAKSGEFEEHRNSAHHGYDDWSPVDSSEALRPGPIMRPLEEAGLTDYLLLPRGVDNMTGQTAPYRGGHRSANVTALTCAPWVMETRVRSNGSDYEVAIPQGPSIEQVIAQRLADEDPTPFVSVDLKVAGHQYGSPFFAGPASSVTSEVSPQAAMATYFSGVTSSGPDPEVLRRNRMRRSVLDGVVGSLRKMHNRLGYEDRLVLEAHEAHVRSIEERIQQISQLACTAPDPISKDPERSPDIAALHADLILHALRCRLTNVATLQISDFVTPWVDTPFTKGSNSLGHTLHHAGRDVGDQGDLASRREDWHAEMLANRQWRMSIFARILSGLRDTPEGDSNMLDNSVALYTSEFSYGAIHSVTDLPVLLAGRAGGRWRTGRHLNYNLSTTGGYRTETSTHNVFTSILHAFGYDDAHFGSDDAVFRGPLDFS
jgi:hypothetical protein